MAEKSLKIGLCNIGHIKIVDSDGSYYSRFVDYVTQVDCDILIVNEGNEAIQLDGYNSIHADESPFKGRLESDTDQIAFRQVSIYYKSSMLFQIRKITVESDDQDRINNLETILTYAGKHISLHGILLTIKGRGKKHSDLNLPNMSYESKVNDLIERFEIQKVRSYLPATLTAKRAGRILEIHSSGFLVKFKKEILFGRWHWQTTQCYT